MNLGQECGRCRFLREKETQERRRWEMKRLFENLAVENATSASAPAAAVTPGSGRAARSSTIQLAVRSRHMERAAEREEQRAVDRDRSRSPVRRRSPIAERPENHDAPELLLSKSSSLARRVQQIEGQALLSGAAAGKVQAPVDGQARSESTADNLLDGGPSGSIQAVGNSQAGSKSTAHNFVDTGVGDEVQVVGDGQAGSQSTVQKLLDEGVGGNTQAAGDGHVGSTSRVPGPINNGAGNKAQAAGDGLTGSKSTANKQKKSNGAGST